MSIIPALRRLKQEDCSLRPAWAIERERGRKRKRNQ
jgi:hypothetical protein